MDVKRIKLSNWFQFDTNFFKKKKNQSRVTSDAHNLHLILTHYMSIHWTSAVSVYCIFPSVKKSCFKAKALRAFLYFIIFFKYFYYYNTCIVQFLYALSFLHCFSLYIYSNVMIITNLQNVLKNIFNFSWHLHNDWSL